MNELPVAIVPAGDGTQDGILPARAGLRHARLIPPAGVRHQRVSHLGRPVDPIVASPQALAGILEREAEREVRAVGVTRGPVAEQREAVAALPVADFHPVEDDVVLDVLPGVIEGVRQLALTDVEGGILRDPLARELGREQREQLVAIIVGRAGAG